MKPFFNRKLTAPLLCFPLHSSGTLIRSFSLQPRDQIGSILGTAQNEY